MRARVVGLLLGLTACTPPLDPPWLITGPRELALDVEVIAQGPYGEPIATGSRTPRDALPGDTLALAPVVVDAEGRLDPTELEATWMLCNGIYGCLLRGDEVSQRPTCTGDEIQPRSPCRFADGGRVTLTLADLPEQIPLEGFTVFDLLTGPTVAMVASPPGGPGLEACLSRLDARARMDGCLLTERVLGLGPLGEMVALLEQAGIDPGIGPDADTLLARPRNRNPAVEELVVSHGDETRVVAAGSVVAVPSDVEISLTVAATDDDYDTYEVELEDQRVSFSDPLTAQWWLDTEVEQLEGTSGELTTRLLAEGPARVRVYVVLRDGYDGEGWGWLDLEVGG
ncbi:MAG: hypothetical protein H6712_19305 [Myxococcales bacterium]|nr:hypothetical protein [Myxococcales bacterium]MCB9716023.1 hypothetical protein [Myxococcales bacterium]